MRKSVFLSVAFATFAFAHGDAHSQKPVVDPNADWVTKHMAGMLLSVIFCMMYQARSMLTQTVIEEHHIQGWDIESFFTLHDYNGDGWWQAAELMRTYGLFDESNKGMSEKRKDEVRDTLLGLLDTDSDNSVSRQEWKDFIASGKTLPDLNTGPGHHGDDEYEYEIHHWEKYHDDDTKLEDLTHPEDIEHFKKHDEQEDAQDRLEAMQKLSIVEANIPQKFRRQN
ncbi:hypothetical protein F66182_5571 [Fusarium sp. NRRL 66182]|nr:hypothetical protein F66182_5571 [Fusarium sp. NRRL 66182]